MNINTKQINLSWQCINEGTMNISFTSIRLDAASFTKIFTNKDPLLITGTVTINYKLDNYLCRLATDKSFSLSTNSEWPVYASIDDDKRKINIFEKGLDKSNIKLSYKIRIVTTIHSTVPSPFVLTANGNLYV